MDFRMEESSESSSDDYEQLKYNTDSAKRSYKCTFCRRGFTNAQALGGHMNIHRKERAKARQISCPYSLQNTQKDYQSRPPKYSSYPFLETQSNYEFYYQPSPGNFPANPHLHASRDWFNRNSRPLGVTQELLGASLSLRIGPTMSEEGGGSRSVWKNDVDLELRLGHVVHKRSDLRMKPSGFTFDQDG